jgi:hypothetical protein
MRTEPVVSAAALSGVLIALASTFGIVLDLGTVETVVAALLPIALSFLARRKVTPV